jgi:cytochrome P450 family 144
VTTQIPGTLRLDPGVVEDSYPFYHPPQVHAPGRKAPDEEVFALSSFALLADAMARADDPTSHVRALRCQDAEGLPGRLQSLLVRHHERLPLPVILR